MRGQILGHVLAFASPLDEGADFLLLIVQGLNEIELRLEAAPFTRQLLALGRVRPDVGRREFLLELLERFF